MGIIRFVKRQFLASEDLTGDMIFRPKLFKFRPKKSGKKPKKSEGYYSKFQNWDGFFGIFWVATPPPILGF